MLTFLALADTKKPKWIVWENVPGVLSSNGGRDFGTFLSALGNIGYGFAYRVLDAQHFGVAQRRRRVFVVGYLGDWRPAAAVLFESESLQRDSKPSRKKRQETPSDAQGSVGKAILPNVVGSLDTECGGGKLTHQSVNNGHLIPSWWDGGQTAATLTKQNAGGNQRMPDKDNFGAVIEQVAQPQYFENHAQDSRVTGPHNIGNSVSAKYGTGGGNTPIVSQPIAFQSVDYGGDATTNLSPTLRRHDPMAVAQPIPILAGEHPQKGVSIDVCPTLPAAMGMGGGHTPLVPHPIAVDCFNQTINEKTTQTIGFSASDINHIGGVLQTMAIRRLTPKECERLQGFPDDWTKIPYRNKPADQCPDGPRYKACGNSMAVPVMRWIGERIQMIENYLNP